MLIRKRCSAIACILITLLLLLILNIFVYFMVDAGFQLTLVYNQSDELHPVKITDSLPQTNIKIEKALAVKSVQTLNVQKQKFLPAKKYGMVPASTNAARRIQAVAKEVEQRFKNVSESYKAVLQSILKDLEVRDTFHSNLSIAEKWVKGDEVIPNVAPQLGSILNTLCSSKILKADNSKRGTQLKLLLTLEGGQKALFKPKWYERDTIITGPVYAGKDRHNAEVAAFHLSLLLGLRRVPLTVGRRIDLRREVMPVAAPALRETFFQEGNNTCFYGVCFYCLPTDPVCARRDIMEGALILWLPQKFNFARYTHPWQRSYRHNLVARWEVEEDYCANVKKSKPYDLNTSGRLLDLVDTAIFDFLVDNGDRHHIEAPINIKTSSIFLFDNGKSFGNPNEDHLDILAPLYQCCVLRRKTWQNLLNFRGGSLGNSLKQTLRSSHIAPVLTPEHLAALDRRLLLVYASLEVCLRDKPASSVLI